MTLQQTERLKRKIENIHRILAAEKRKFGFYDDSQGLRYLPPGYYVQLGDYAGGLTYLRWFEKSFPDDAAFPEFLFEASIVLFKVGRRAEAGNAAFRTFCSNPYWIDRFLGRPLIEMDIWHPSNVATVEYTRALMHSCKEPELSDFCTWLRDLIVTEDFTRRCSSYIAVYRKLKTETDLERRRLLVQYARQLERSQTQMP